MRIRDLSFLSKANVKGNKSNRAVTVLVCLLVSAVTLITGYTVSVLDVVNNYKESYWARALQFYPYDNAVTEELIAEISSVEHVELVTDAVGISRMLNLGIIRSDDTRISEGLKTQEADIYINELFEGEKKSVIKGKALDDAPVFSCLVPSVFYPYDDAIELGGKDLDYIDGTTLIGKTITVYGRNGDVDFNYFMPVDSGLNEQILTSLKTPEITLEIVGVYPCNYVSSGYYDTIFVSKETKIQMYQLFMEESGIDLSGDSPIAQYWNDPTLHEHLVVVDDYSNISEVSNAVTLNLGYLGLSSTPLQLQDETTVLCANLFKTVGVFLIVAIVCVSVILLVQSAASAIGERKGYIGLMKAIGYKNRQIFIVLLWEQMYLSLRAFLIGGTVSTLATFLINLYMEHGTFIQMQYVMDWGVYLVFLCVSLMITLFVPLITELMLIRRLVKIEPKDAMSAK